MCTHIIQLYVLRVDSEHDFTRKEEWVLLGIFIIRNDIIMQL